MNLALQEAKLAFKEGEIPVGAVLVKDDVLIAKGHNKREKKNDITSHAEIEVLRKTSKKTKNWKLEGYTLYVTLEPCLMCAGAIIQSKISRLVFGCFDKDRGAICSKINSIEEFKLDSPLLVTTSVLEKECQDLINRFFADIRKK